MTFTLPDIWQEMKAMWGGKADGLFAILGVFVFLPVFAQVLFIDTPEIKSIDWNAVQMMMDYYCENVLALLGVRMITLIGGGAMLALLLWEASPSPAEALTRAFRFLPSLFLLSVLITFLVSIGLFALIIPGLFFVAWTIAAEAAMIAEGISNPFTALGRSIRMTAREVWIILLHFVVLMLGTWVVTQLIGVGIGFFGTILLPDEEMRIASALIGALSNTAFAAVTTLYGAVIYRRLAKA